MSEAINGEISVPTPADLAYLKNKLEQSNLPQDHLEQRIVYVIKHNGIVSGCIAARLVWQIEPLYLTPEFDRDASPIAKRRAVYKLARAMFEWLAGPENKTGIRWCFGYITKKPLQRLARDFGMLAAYRKGRFFIKEF